MQVVSFIPASAPAAGRPRTARAVPGKDATPRPLASRWCGAHWMACLKHFLAFSTSPCSDRHGRRLSADTDDVGPQLWRCRWLGKHQPNG